jgi:hypothetical protein
VLFYCLRLGLAWISTGHFNLVASALHNSAVVASSMFHSCVYWLLRSSNERVPSRSKGLNGFNRMCEANAFLSLQ